MPYGDKSKQKEYQRLYYLNYTRKPNIEKQTCKIDMSNYNSKKPIEDIPKTIKQIDILDENGNLKTSNQLKKEIYNFPETSIVKNEELYENDGIPKWIRDMTDDNIIQYADELTNTLDEEKIEDILNYCNSLFGNYKSRQKREYILKELYDSSNRLKRR